VLVTVSGLPGSGTTTAARLVSTRLGLVHLDGGAVFRQLAVDRGVTLAEFSRFAEAHPEIDVELDRRLGARAREGECVLESRLAGWIATNEGLIAVRVWIGCSDETRAARVARRERISVDEAAALNRAREASEHARYLAFYGIDLSDRSVYDLMLDSGMAPPDELADAIVTAAETRFGGPESGVDGGGW